MFVPFVFVLERQVDSENYWHWPIFYLRSAACIENDWPIISHERYFRRFSNVDDNNFGTSALDFLCNFGMNKLPTTNEMLSLKSYPVLQAKEDTLIAKYASQFDAWVDLLNNENMEFEQIIGDLLDRITNDFGEKPEGVLYYETPPKALLSATSKRNIPTIVQSGSGLRQPLTSIRFSLNFVNDFSADYVKWLYEKNFTNNANVPMLSHKGLLRLTFAEHYLKDIHDIDKEPEYDAGVLFTSIKCAVLFTGNEYVSDMEMYENTKKLYDKVLIRSRFGGKTLEANFDNSPTCFHFSCKCKHVVGFMTKGIFEAMLAARIAHEYGSNYYHGFCNNGIHDDSIGHASLAFLNFIIFRLCTPFSWLNSPEYLRLLLSSPPESEMYMRSFKYYTRGISQEDLEFYYMPGNPDRAYRLGDPLYFTSGHKPHEYAAYYCTGGLLGTSITEKGTWSNGESTSFEFDLTESVTVPLIISILLNIVTLDLNSANPAQTVTCNVNGSDCGSITLTPLKRHMRFVVRPESFTDKLRITFSYSFLQPSGEHRNAVAFERMYISRTNQTTIEDSVFDIMENHQTYIEKLGAQIENQQTQIETIYNSRSWKLGNNVMKTAAKILPKRNR